MIRVYGEGFPKNYLLKKWYKEYPMDEICKFLAENNMENHNCDNCDKCPRGELFKIPKEDLEEYKKYLEKVKEYDELHDSNYAGILERDIKKR